MFSYAFSFICLSLKLHSRKVTQSVPKELQVKIRNRTDALLILMEEEEGEDFCRKPFGGNYMYLYCPLYLCYGFIMFWNELSVCDL